MIASDNAVLELIFNPELQGQGFPPPDTQDKDAYASSIDPELLKELKQLEHEGIEHANNGKVQDALNSLDACISREPAYAAAYNNRAQVHRLMKNNEAAMKDLDSAIEKANDQNWILRQAYTQRAILKKQMGDKDGSLDDFQLGAKHGSPIAREIVVSENPYAKMCNQAVMEVMGREFNIQ
ncbi:tetratricopeptide repeat protein 36-like protein [Zychaea mexicana]|uniref:tetratricopeptide repeat protein 36-like protein n=1 Tax=Zychaea mexicana TaxID=64656 RepID=UPI0022FE85A0|nr:tetratricopeptide repeat protein 36-like protein [Zychaea mexicana]KAI9491338.1 tetratricopeptide repeat protein 36-like protein [Zychaea mexicana]